MRAHHRGGAGRSAQRRYRELRAAWRRRFRIFRLVLGGMVAATFLFSVPAPVGWKYPIGVAGGALLMLFVLVGDSSPGADRYWLGALGERRTGRALCALEREGWVVRHDLAGRRQANIDHVVIGPGGAFLIDSKRWSGRVQIIKGVPAVERSEDRGGGWTQPGLADQLTRAADGLRQALQYPLQARGPRVRPVVAIWGDFPARVVVTDAVVYVHGDELVSWLRTQGECYDTEAVARLGGALRRLPAQDRGKDRAGRP